MNFIDSVGVINNEKNGFDGEQSVYSGHFYIITEKPD